VSCSRVVMGSRGRTEMQMTESCTVNIVFFWGFLVCAESAFSHSSTQPNKKIRAPRRADGMTRGCDGGEKGQAPVSKNWCVAF
jgi:hypothetical protein